MVAGSLVAGVVAGLLGALTALWLQAGAGVAVLCYGVAGTFGCALFLLVVWLRGRSANP